MKSNSWYMIAVLVMARQARSDNSTLSDDTCGLQPWEAALEDWATSEVHNTRQGRIMALPPSQGYYVSERIDLVPPPPPRQQMQHRGPYPAAPTHTQHYSHQHPPQHHPQHSQQQTQQQAPQYNSQQAPQYNSQQAPQYNSQQTPQYNTQQAEQQGPPVGGSAPSSYDEWQVTPPPPPGAGKIINRPPNPYKDQFKPSYPPQSPPQPIPVQSVNDRVDAAPPPPPHKQVSETDVYLLRAIEKLVYRVDLMEKRLRKMEENLHYVVAGTEIKPEPCPGNFTRVGGGCYHISTDSVNWKAASFACRKLKANLLELDDEEKKKFVQGLLIDKKLKGSDFWTGGLNPGLLWIWSHSAKPVANTTSAETESSSSIAGEGRCLALVHHERGDYVYRGQDCTLRHRYVCERDEDKEKLGNEIERVARQLREGRRKPKIMWTDDVSP